MEKLLTSHQVAKLLNVWPHTLRRTPGGHRRYKESQMMALIGEETPKNEFKRCAVYARVSTVKQAEAGSLQRQKERLITYAVEKGYQVKAVYNEIASGLNENRRELARLAKTTTKGEIDIIVIAYKDRLARFGYKYLEQYFESYGVGIDIMEQDEEKSPQEELVEDMIAIVTSFTPGFERRAVREGVPLVKVKPPFTSLIGILKYQQQYGISHHESASYVIARRGLRYTTEKIPKQLTSSFINKKEDFDKLSEWKQWSAIKKAAVAAIKKQTMKEVKSLVFWQHHRKQLLGIG